MRVYFLAIVLLAGRAFAASSADIWPAKVDALDAAALNRAISRIEKAPLPEELRPAADFEAVFLRIISGAPLAAWLADIQRFARLEGDGPLQQGIRNAARAWLARIEMQAIDAALRDFYAESVRFPDKLDEVKLPPDLRKDPWGEDWTYRATAGFAKLTGQRYELGPKRFPRLPALRDRVAPGAGWKITPRDIAGRKAMEFRRGNAAAPLATLEEGGKVEDCTLLFIGENWVLMASPDQLFALEF